MSENFETEVHLYPEKDRRLKYLRLVHRLGSVIAFFFILEINFLFHVTRFNLVLLGLFSVFLLSPLIYRVTNSYVLCASVAWVSISSLAAFLLYIGGAFLAPGIFWLTAIPLTAGVMLGKRGIIVGIVGVVGIMILFRVLPTLIGIPHDITDQLNWEFERTINTFVSLVFITSIAYYFIDLEEQSRHELDQQKAETESLLRVIMHDVATPITILEQSITGLGEVINLERREQRLARANRAVVSVVSILAQVRQMKAMKDGKSRLMYCKANLNQILDRVVGMLQSRAEEKDVTIFFDSCGSNVFVWADAVILESVIFSNFLTNAIKFSQRSSQITVRLRVDGHHAVVEIEDQGIGIPSHLMPHLFKLNRATSRTGTAGEKGTGYGLPLAAEFVARMNGKIAVDSSTGASTGSSEAGSERRSGTCIRVTFPIVEANEGTVSSKTN
jgi:signal transduction histidine kinase